MLVILVGAAAVWLWWSRQHSANNGDPGASATADEIAASGTTTTTGPARIPPTPLRTLNLSEQFVYGGTVRVHGPVIDVGTGERVPFVDVIFGSMFAESTANSGAEGYYSIELGSGSWQIRALGDGVYALPQRLMVGRVTESMEFPITVSRVARVNGKVVDQHDQPVAGATVAFAAPGHSMRALTRTYELTPQTLSEADGSFSLAVPAGDIHITAELDGIKGEAFLPVVAPGSRHDDVVVKLAPAATVAGVVVDPEGQPVARASVYAAVRVPGTRVATRQEVTADDSGRFEFARLTAGVLVLEARAPGFAASEPTALTTQPGAELSDVLLTLQAATAISGRVVDSGGGPMSGVTVRAARKGSWRKAMVAETDHEGAFVIDGVAGGPYTLEASKDGHAKARRDGVSAPAEGVELVLASPGGLRGLVTAGGEQPVRELTVAVDRYRPAGADSYRKGRDSKRFFVDDGSFELYPLDPGTYDITVSATGHAPARVDAVEVPQGGWGQATVQLEGGARLAGVVRSKTTRKPVAGARVSVFSGYEGMAVFTDDAGKFTIKDIAPGRRTISVERLEYVSLHKGGIELIAGDNQLDLELTPAADDRDGSQLAGIGAIFYARDDGLFVRTLVPGSPAARARWRRHDRLLSVNGVAVDGRRSSEVIEMIRGPAGTPVTIEMQRGDRRMSYELVRALLEVPAEQNGLVAALAPR